MTQPLLAAVCQMTTTSDVDRNRETADRLVRLAASRGARWICLPEMWTYIGTLREHREVVEPLSGPTGQQIRGWARELGVTIFGGSFPETAPNPDKCFNTQLVVGPDGEDLAVYRKIHLFDIDLPGGPRLKESDDYEPGTELGLAATPDGVVGLTTCYDLRFPTLYQALRDRGAEAVVVPAAFTERTGKAHWEVLLRARAIEQQVYVLAAGQDGEHKPGRRSHGHSMIVGPWGTVLAQVPDGEGVALAPVERDRVASVRRSLPCAEHRRAFTG